MLQSRIKRIGDLILNSKFSNMFKENITDGILSKNIYIYIFSEVHVDDECEDFEPIICDRNEG